MSWSKSEQEFLSKNIENWDKLSDHKRLKVLQVIENKTAKEEGRKRRKIKTEYLEEGVKGTFRDNEPHRIYIDINFLKEGNVYNVIDTVFHEGRHAYQYDVTHGEIPEGKLSPNIKTQKSIWVANNEIYNDSKDYDYRFQPKEDDTNNFALKKTKEIFKQSNKANEEKFKEFLREKSTETENYRYNARKKYDGDNYKQEISKEIQRKYERNVGIRAYAKEYQELQKELNKLEKGKTSSQNQEKIEVLQDKERALRAILLREYDMSPETAIEQLKEYNKTTKNSDEQIMNNKNPEKSPEPVQVTPQTDGEKDVLTHLNTIKTLKQNIGYLENVRKVIIDAPSRESLGRSIDVLREAQGKLYGSLNVKHGIDAEGANKIITLKNEADVLTALRERVAAYGVEAVKNFENSGQYDAGVLKDLGNRAVNAQGTPKSPQAPPTQTEQEKIVANLIGLNNQEKRIARQIIESRKTLTPEEIQELERAREQKRQEYKEAFDEMVNRPDGEQLTKQWENAVKLELKIKSEAKTKELEKTPSRTR